MNLFVHEYRLVGCHGLGSIKEQLIKFRQERKYIRISKSCPKVLSDLIGLLVYNNSTSGITN